MPTSISDIWVPPVWLASVREQQVKFPSLFNSPVVASSPQAAELASGAGETATIPFWKEITDQNDEIQVEDTEPVTDNKITTGQMKAIACNRVTKNSATALSAAVTGEDPVGEMTAQIAARRLMQRQKTLLSLVRGAFGSGATTPDEAVGVVRDLRVDRFLEAGAGANPDKLMSVDLFIDAKALMGEMMDTLGPGCIWLHPNIVAALEKADVNAFDKQSMGAFTVRTYRGLPLFVSESLVRAGTASGYVYDTYLFAPRTIALGEKPQIAGDVVDVAALQMDRQLGKNNEVIYDRTRFVMHMNGLKWVGTPVGQSPTNAELGTTTNWNLVFTTANRVGAVCIRTNG